MDILCIKICVTFRTTTLLTIHCCKRSRNKTWTSSDRWKLFRLGKTFQLAVALFTASLFYRQEFLASKGGFLKIISVASDMHWHENRFHGDIGMPIEIIFKKPTSGVKKKFRFLMAFRTFFNRV